MITQHVYTLEYNVSPTKVNEGAFDFLRSFMNFYRMPAKPSSSFEVEYYYRKDSHHSLEQGSAHFVPKEPDGKYFRVCRLCRLRH